MKTNISKFNNAEYSLKKMFERRWCQIRDRDQLICDSSFYHHAKKHGFKYWTALGQIYFVSFDNL